MKTTTSKLLLAALSLTLIIFVTSAFNKQSAGNKYAVMRTIEAGVGNGSKIIITYEDGKYEEIDLDKGITSNMVPNMLKINKAINELSGKGYQLLSSGGGDYFMMYTFVKK